MIKELGEIPYCSCKCGEKVNVHPDRIGSYSQYKRSGYPKFINYHNSRTPEFKKQVSNQMSGENNFMFGKTGILSPFYKPSKTIEDLISEFGEIPLCNCKCGNNVFVDPKYYDRYKKNSGFPEFIQGHHVRVNNPMDNPEIRARQLEATNTLEFKRNITERLKINNPMWNPEVVKKSKESWTSERRNKCSGKKCHFYGKIYHSQKIFPHLTPSQGIVKMCRWDRKKAQYYDSNNIQYVYEPKAFEIVLNDGCETTYTPDFYLPNTDEYIEVKGYFRGDAKLKFETFKELYPEIKIKLLMEQDLKDLGINLKITIEEKEIMNIHKNKNKSL